MGIIADNILKLRLHSGLSRTEIADELGVSYSAFSKYEQGKRLPDVTLLIKIADYYDISLDELAGRRKLKLSKTELRFGEDPVRYGDITREEKEVLNLYDQLSQSEKDAILRIMKAMANNKE